MKKHLFSAVLICTLAFCFAFSSDHEKASPKIGQPITKQELIMSRFLRAELDNFVFEGIKYKVEKYHYTFLYGDNNNQVLSDEVTGCFLSTKLNDLIKSSKSGNILMFHDISLYGPNGHEKTAQTLVFRIQ